MSAPTPTWQPRSDLLAALCPMAVELGYRVARADGGKNETLVIIPQADIDRYRVDLIRFAFAPQPRGQ